VETMGTVNTTVFAQPRFAGAYSRTSSSSTTFISLLPLHLSYFSYPATSYNTI